ncbi:hypothetical protein FA95DRAFT_1611482 [Auriscalpium vulgare]|uniref:Uncharacterized protein n=1 Tax=Auriscalpium vulgare TaxID=40419 RepID=A0ACB8RAM3_9AGAM|nr:hypothetical protein FA95DRAFT_1611482 [Auriscalpium vulgare]
MVLSQSKPNNRAVRTLSPGNFDNEAAFTVSNLFNYSKGYTAITNMLTGGNPNDKVLFIGPRYGNVRGAIAFDNLLGRLYLDATGNFFHMTLPHRCFAARVCRTIFRDLAIQCLPDCFPQAAHTMMTSPPSPSPEPELPSPARSDIDLPERLTLPVNTSAAIPVASAAVAAGAVADRRASAVGAAAPPAVVPSRRPRSPSPPAEQSTQRQSQQQQLAVIRHVRARALQAADEPASCTSSASGSTQWDVIDLTNDAAEVAPAASNLQQLPYLTSRLHNPVPYVPVLPNVNAAGAATGSLVRTQRWARSIIDTLRGPPTATQFRMVAPSIDAGAIALTVFLGWHCGDRAGYLSMQDKVSAFAPGVTLEDVPPVRLFGSTSWWSIGKGKGTAPKYSVLRAAMIKCATRPSFWRPTALFAVPDLHPSTDIIPSRQLAFQQFGLLCFFYMVLTQSGPDPVSPFLIQYIVDGRDAFNIDAEFIRLIDPQILRTLEPWMAWRRNPVYPIPPTSELGLLLGEANISVNSLTNPIDNDTQTGVERSLLSNILFGSLDPSNHPDLRAFALGFDTFGGMQNLEGSVKPYLLHMYNRRVQQPSDVLDILEFRSAHEETQTSGRKLGPVAKVDVQYEDKFAKRIKSYLRGSGHPAHERMANFFVHHPVLKDVEGDEKTYRSRMMLRVMTGVDLLPPRDVKLTFSFKHDHKKLTAEQLKNKVSAAIVWMACLAATEVKIDATVRNLLDEPIEDEGKASYFDLWMHGMVILADSRLDNYNGERL